MASVLPEQTATESVWKRTWHSRLPTPFLTLRGEEIRKQFPSLLELALIRLGTDFEDGIGQQLSAF
jgi:hypothetical protein